MNTYASYPRDEDGGAYGSGRAAEVRAGDTPAPGEEVSVGPATGTIPRFTTAARALHWSTAAVVLVCALTGLVLYVGPLTALVGRRTLVRDIHVVTGLAMPVPLLVAYAGRWRTGVRADVRRLGRWTRADRRWLRSRGRDAGDQVGKFNAGQKVNAAFVLGMIPVMVVTGSIMRWYEPFDIGYRTGATFVHDWTAIATWLVVTGHILFALADPDALRGMVTGRVARSWASDKHPLWAAESTATPGVAGDGDGSADPDAPAPMGRRVGEPAERPLR